MRIFNIRLDEALETVVGRRLVVGGYLKLMLEEPVWPVGWAEMIVKSPVVRSWLSGLGFRGSIGNYRAGNIGRAYEVGEDGILKLTTKSDEAHAAAVLKGKNLKNAARVHDVKLVMSRPHWSVPDRRVNIYAIVMEKLNIGIGKKWRIAADAVYEYLDHNDNFIEDFEAAVDVTIERFLDDKYRRDDTMVYLVRRVMRAIYDVQEESGLLIQDPHAGNVAFKGREPAFFDLGRSSINWDNPATSSVGRIEKLEV